MDAELIQKCREEITQVGRAAHQKGLIVGRGGNISIRLGPQEFISTAHSAALGFLKPSDFLVMNVQGEIIEGGGRPSTESKLHGTIYRETEAGSVVHLHPPYTAVLAVRGVEIKPMTFESSLFLGKTIPIIPQESPSVTKMEGVIDALRISNIIILKEHGTVAVGDDLWDAFFLTEILEEAAMMACLAKSLGALPGEEKGALQPERETLQALPVFSKEHISRMVELINQDEEARRLGKENHLTVRYAIKLLDTGQVCNFHFQEGEIVTVTNDEDAEFVIAGRRQQWVAVFNGLIDPFAATTQKKLKLQKGSIGDLSKWYPPFYRIFALWNRTPVE
jgi:L-fuculose-phosphate aldolase